MKEMEESFNQFEKKNNQLQPFKSQKLSKDFLLDFSERKQIENDIVKFKSITN